MKTDTVVCPMGHTLFTLVSPGQAEVLTPNSVVITEVLSVQNAAINAQSASDASYRLSTPPHMIGDLEKSSFSNIEQQSLEFVKYTVEPWIIRLEKASIAVTLWGKKDLYPSSKFGRNQQN